jgi:serine/threonine protein kinase
VELQALLPKYEVSALIGRGGMGAVYRGRQRALQREVAIKILPPGMEMADASFGERFRQEARAMAKLNYPGIVAVYDFGQAADGMRYIVMEYIDGIDVAEMLARKGRLSSTDAMAITAHVCDALKYAHERGIIHRDIKPANIMVGYNGVVKVADFGLARMNRGEESSLTKSGLAMGTMHYIAPESLILGTSVDHRADIYALGVMLYQMLTGDLPRGMFALPSQKVAGLDPRYDQIITCTLQNDREERYPSVDDLRHALDAILTKPVAQVDPNAAEAPAALNTTARPKRPPPPREPSTPQPQRTDWGFWLPVSAVALSLTAFLMWKSFLQPERRAIQRIEGEAMKVIQMTAGETQNQDMGAFLTSVWSGAAQLLWIKGGKDDSLTLLFPVNEAGRQRVKAVFSLSSDFALVDVAVDGKRVTGSPFDLQAEVPTVSDILDFGVFDLTQGEHELKITLLDTHARDSVGAGAYVTALDYVQLEPPVILVLPAAAGTDVALTARPSASQCSGGDHVKHINDGKVIAEPNSTHPQRMTWHPRKGGLEWAQLEWETPQTINESQIVWFEDGASTMPVFWRLLYREESGAWVPVDATFQPAVRDQWCVVKFPAVKTTALRISAQCQERWSAGICQWKAIAAGPASTVNPPELKRDLSLVDLSPLRAQNGWGLYRANHYGSKDDRDGRGVFLGGKACTHYLWAHPNSRTEFAIPSGYTCFTATGIGPSYNSTGLPIGAYGSWKYIVEVDGTTLLESNELRNYSGHELPAAVTFPAGSKRLTLITDSCGGANSDHAFWAYPTLSAVKSSQVLIPDAKEPPTLVLRLASDPSKTLGVSSAEQLKDNIQPTAAFKLVPGIADPNYVSLESVSAQKHYVRHRWATIYVNERPERTDLVYEADATWKMTQLGNGKARFEASNYPGTYLAVKGDGTVIQLRDAPLAQSIFLLK